MVDGSSFVIAQNKWYRLTASLDFTANTITAVFVQNITDNTAPQQLYFGAGNATFPYTLDESRWDGAQVRSGLSNNPVVYLDNIRFETQSVGGPLTEVYAEDFETVTVGALSGQGGWAAGISSDPWYASKTVRPWMLDALFPSTFGVWSRGWGPNEVAGPDGMTVAAQYIFGSPRPGSAAVSPAVRWSTNTFSLETVVRTNDPAWRIFGESSSTLNAGSWTTNGIFWQSSTNQNNVVPGTERRIFTVPPGTDTRKFLRIRAESP